MPRSEARQILALYSTWPVVQVDVELILDAATLEDEAQMSFWDALIVEAARRAGADRIMSEDFGSGRRIAGIAITNPFDAAS
jgi:predicted nucleic acid-binding protein